MTSAQVWLYGITGGKESEAPAKVGEKILGALGVKVRKEQRPALNTAMHALYGTSWGLPFGVLFGRGGPTGPAKGLAFGFYVWAREPGRAPRPRRRPAALEAAAGRARPGPRLPPRLRRRHRGGLRGLHRLSLDRGDEGVDEEVEGLVEVRAGGRSRRRCSRLTKPCRAERITRTRWIASSPSMPQPASIATKIRRERRRRERLRLLSSRLGRADGRRVAARMLDGVGAVGDGDGADARPPASGRPRRRGSRRRISTTDVERHRPHQRRVSLDVVVEGGGTDAELGGDPRQRHRLEALGVGDPRRRRDHRRFVERFVPWRGHRPPSTGHLRRLADRRVHRRAGLLDHLAVPGRQPRRLQRRAAPWRSRARSVCARSRSATSGNRGFILAGVATPPRVEYASPA